MMRSAASSTSSRERAPRRFGFVSAGTVVVNHVMTPYSFVVLTTKLYGMVWKSGNAVVDIADRDGRHEPAAGQRPDRGDGGGRRNHANRVTTAHHRRAEISTTVSRGKR